MNWTLGFLPVFQHDQTLQSFGKIGAQFGAVDQSIDVQNMGAVGAFSVPVADPLLDAWLAVKFWTVRADVRVRRFVATQ